MRACMLQPRGGSNARADFAEQVAVHVDFRLPSSSGGDSEYDFVDTVLLGISNLCVVWL